MVSVHNANGATPRPPGKKVRYELLTLGDELLLGLTAWVWSLGAFRRRDLV